MATELRRALQVLQFGAAIVRHASDARLKVSLIVSGSQRVPSPTRNQPLLFDGPDGLTEVRHRTCATSPRVACRLAGLAPKFTYSHWK
jgi:hypothetical protein